MNNEDIRDDRPEAFYRIQRRDEYAQFCEKEKYLESAQVEVRMFAIYILKLFNKKGAESKKIIAKQLEDINKGYPIGFTDYLTYDERREKNFTATIIRELGEDRHSNGNVQSAGISKKDG